jgi:hypothetical protein
MCNYLLYYYNQMVFMKEFRLIIGEQRVNIAKIKYTPVSLNYKLKFHKIKTISPNIQINDVKMI